MFDRLPPLRCHGAQLGHRAADAKLGAAGGMLKNHGVGLGGPRPSSAFATIAKMLKYRPKGKRKRLPRKSAAALAISSPSSRATRLRPPLSLAEPEAKLFKQIIANCALDHFRLSDLPLLC